MKKLAAFLAAFLAATGFYILVDVDYGVKIQSDNNNSPIVNSIFSYVSITKEQPAPAAAAPVSWVPAATAPLEIQRASRHSARTVEKESLKQENPISSTSPPNQRRQRPQVLYPGGEYDSPPEEFAPERELPLTINFEPISADLEFTLSDSNGVKRTVSRSTVIIDRPTSTIMVPAPDSESEANESGHHD